MSLPSPLYLTEDFIAFFLGLRLVEEKKMVMNKEGYV